MAANFVLVEWIGDPKPDCWDIIKSDAFLRPAEVKEGAVLDAHWKKGAETSPCNVLKINDSKTYLTSVKENEYFKPWKNSTITNKRKAVPKNLDGFLTGNDAQSDVVSSEKGIQKKQPPKKRLKKQPAKKNSDESGHEEPPSDVESEVESHYSKADIKSSKEEAEKVLASSLLTKSREQSPTIPKQVSNLKTSNTSQSLEVILNEESDTKEDISEQAKVFGLPDVKNTNTCCEHCPLLWTQINTIQADIELLKRQVKSVKSKSSKIAEQLGSASANPERELERECRDLVVNSTSLFNTINVLMRKLFTSDEILQHSVSGKASNSHRAAKPKFNSEKMDLIRKIAIDLHGTDISKSITDKVQAVKKAVQREHAANN